MFRKVGDTSIAYLRVQKLDAFQFWRWGEGREVGVIPPWAMRDIAPIKDDKEREKAMRNFFRENPAFLAYDAFIK